MLNAVWEGRKTQRGKKKAKTHCNSKNFLSEISLMLRQKFQVIFANTPHCVEGQKSSSTRRTTKKENWWLRVQSTTRTVAP